MKVKVGDNVRILAGKDKGKEGRIIKTLKKDNKVVVEGINVVKKHVKPNQAEPESKITEKEAPIHVSNVALLDPKTKKATKVRYEVKDGKKVRVAKKSSTVIA
mgnify:CR=1 FL=1